LGLVLSTTVNDDTLRESFDRPDDVHVHVTQLDASLAEIDDPPALARVHAELGSFRRVLGQLYVAETHLRKALSIAGQHSPASRQAIVYEIRLAHVLHWQRRWDEAEALFTNLLLKCRGDVDVTDLTDFVYQHRGKMRFDRDDLENALSDFSAALELRRTKGATELISSTEQAIRATQRRLSLKPVVQTEELG
jgi:tetratricopeptide (TPR) repeat protein